MNAHSAATETALAYFHAWSGHDVDKAMAYIADDIVCESPGGRIEGADAYRAFLEPFVGIVTGTRMLAAFGDERTALVMYDTSTLPVTSAPAAELVTVRDGVITNSRIIFDRLPFPPPPQ
ncbi:nuclear transport factor 2 family protein [Nocardia sp. CDC160]|uniref:nuclear transport factor 2 family protein n=1 Tax=Nocardia sp. CDC160 TaxID=3112166 RepID=UPI002DB69045|nr:nuclear transport factor 2 family protein [Nocardia sp. CDC160]MEC3920426.1 nuclear transport factor 2 family protein [Nocardia sp. CDC160]